MSTISTFGTCQICGLIQPKQGQCRDCNGIVKPGGIADPVPPAGYPTAEIAQEAALGVYDIDFPGPDEEVGPVPPAGVEPETIAYTTNGRTRVVLADQKDHAVWNAGRPLIYLEDHRAHVTRLQAEVAELNDEIIDHRNYTKACREEREARESELTKARDRVYELEHAIFHLLDDSGDVGRAKAYLSNQSAPTDKGQDDCAHSEANKHGCPECGEEFKP